MSEDPAKKRAGLARENVAQVLEAAGLPRHVPPRRRKRDPSPADGFRVISEADADADGGGVLAVWVTNKEWRYPASPDVRAEARRMSAEYTQALEEAGFAVEPTGLGWDYVRVLPVPNDPATSLTTKSSPPPEVDDIEPG